MIPKCRHERSVLRCLACFPRPKNRYPKDMKACRGCKNVLIHKDWPLCAGCREWEHQDWLEKGYLHRQERHVMLMTP